MNEFSWQFPSGAGPSCGDRNDSAGCDSQIQKDQKRLIHFENCSSVYRLKKQVLFKTLFEIFSVKRTLGQLLNVLSKAYFARVFFMTMTI
jgi:hypothetical protein